MAEYAESGIVVDMPIQIRIIEKHRKKKDTQYQAVVEIGDLVIFQEPNEWYEKPSEAVGRIQWLFGYSLMKALEDYT